ncbi:MAG: hypothetical protein H6656_15690 [Ardenticatenaceae bacterium]|nr:hypothetical protein [Ardenticatenaceae bacterium]
MNYAEIEGEVYCTAGFGSVSHWYRNILDHPSVEIWLPNGRFQALAQAHHRRTQHPAYLPGAHQQWLAAPAFGIHPQTLSDDGWQP